MGLRIYRIFMKRAFTLAILIMGALPVHAQDCVILLHGLLRTELSMSRIFDDLINEDYEVVNITYPSTTDDIFALADEAIEKGIKACSDFTRKSFVTHSMGGILVRAYYSQVERPRPHRVVMLAPPNQGSEVIDSELFAQFGAISGKSGASLGTGADSIPNQLGPVDYEVGVIAGNVSVNPLFSYLIPGGDDGAVAVERTHVAGETDWILVPASHTLMTENKIARRYIIEFLQNGRFDH